MSTSILEIASHLDRLVNADLLLMLVFQVAVMLLTAYYFSKPGRSAQVWKIPLVTAFEDIVASSAERGRPVFINIKRGRPEGGSLASNQAFMAMTKYVARSAGNSGTNLLVFSDDYQAFLQAKDYARQGYLESNRPEMYKDDNCIFVSGDEWTTGGKELYIMGQIRSLQPGGLISLGNFFNEVINTCETAHQSGALTAACADGGWETCFNAAVCDYYSMGDEYIGAAAYMAGDPKLNEALIGADVAKIVILGAMLVVLIVSLLGVKTYWSPL